MSDITSWSETDSSNNATPPAGWPAGMLPSQVEPAARATMGAIKRWHDRINATLTSGGSANAQTLSYTVAYAALTAGDVFAFIPGFTNTSAMTLDIDSIGAKSVFAWGAALIGGEVIKDVPAVVIWDGSEFHLINPQPIAPAAQTLTLASGFTAEGSPYATPSYRLFPNGQVQVEAVIVCGTISSATTVATLPFGARPASTMWLHAVNLTTNEPILFSVDVNGHLRTRGSGTDVSTGDVIAIGPAFFPIG